VRLTVEHNFLLITVSSRRTYFGRGGGEVAIRNNYVRSYTKYVQNTLAAYQKKKQSIIANYQGKKRKK
jgi:hypothetical protein